MEHFNLALGIAAILVITKDTLVKSSQKQQLVVCMITQEVFCTKIWNLHMIFYPKPYKKQACTCMLTSLTWLYTCSQKIIITITFSSILRSPDTAVNWGRHQSYGNGPRTA